MSECQCYAIAIEPERKKLWEKVFLPDGRVPITCPLPVGRAELAGQEADFYLIDFKRVSPAAKEDLIFAMAEKFNLAPAEIRRDIEARGCPIKVDSVMVAWCKMHSLAAIS